MSNIGKSHWAKRLAAESGFEWVDCDLMVEQRLTAQLAEFNYKGIEGVAEWMGHPFDPQYPETSRIYIDCEKAVMLEVIDKLCTTPPDSKPLVVDTTGSVIYTGADIAEQLGKLSRIVYLEASPRTCRRAFFPLHALSQTAHLGQCSRSTCRRNAAAGDDARLSAIAGQPRAALRRNSARDNSVRAA